MVFPVDIKIEDDLTLQNIEEILPWYSEINPKRTVEIINYMKNKVQNGNQIFYDIYTDQEKKDDPSNLCKTIYANTICHSIFIV